MNKEDYFIGCFSKSDFIGDDAAILDNMCISQDAFFENVHFRRDWTTLYNIARKAMLVNISDAIVMNGRPRYALLTVAIPKEYTRRELKELARGFQDAADDYNITIIGGDTIANVKLDISVTILAECRNPVMRTGMKEGDFLAYTGKLGESRRDLIRLLRGGSVSPSSRFIHPVLREKFFFRSGKVHACGDGYFRRPFSRSRKAPSRQPARFRLFPAHTETCRLQWGGVRNTLRVRSPIRKEHPRPGEKNPHPCHDLRESGAKTLPQYMPT